MGKLFGTDGIRGVVNAGLDADLAYKVGLAAAAVLGKSKKPGEKPLVTIGKDTRISGDLLKGSLIAGLCTAGADVLVEDLTAEELKTYRLEGTDERIPLLEEVLELFQDRTPLIIELKAERGNHAALAEATCRMLDRYRVHYCIESFDPRCLIWLKKNRPEIVRGQLSEQFLRHGETAGHGKATMWLLGNLFSNIAAKPDFIAYRFSDRDNLCLRWCRKFYHVQEINWTIRTKEEMEAAEAQGNLVIFECFDPKG